MLLIKLNMYCGISVFSLFLVLIPEMESLKCYKCLNLECPEGDDGGNNEKLCQSVRTFIVQTMAPYYELGPTGYIGPCPGRDERLKWTMLQNENTHCPYIRETATCSLGRLQVITEYGKNTVVVSHATILGCMKPELLIYVKAKTQNKPICSVYSKNNSADHSYYFHKLQLENCPKPSDYCNDRSFCIPFFESVIKPFVERKNSNSFESGIIISIIVFIAILFTVGFFGSFCWNPLSRSVNYSPTQVQNLKSESFELENSNTCPATAAAPPPPPDKL